MAIKDLGIDENWTLFLDRDGVINHKLPDDYVKNIQEFQFIQYSAEAVAELGKIFGRVLIVTNQQGIGKRLMTDKDLELVHNHMMEVLREAGGRIDKIYHCPHLVAENSEYRKPEIGMALKAKEDFPEIDFSRSLMVGDSLSDLQFGRNAGMKTVWVSGYRSKLNDDFIENADFIVTDLRELANRIKKKRDA